MIDPMIVPIVKITTIKRLQVDGAIPCLLSCLLCIPSKFSLHLGSTPSDWDGATCDTSHINCPCMNSFSCINEVNENEFSFFIVDSKISYNSYS